MFPRSCPGSASAAADGGELVDIYSVGAPLPLPTTVLRFGFTLGLYWSNAAGACVG